MLMSNRIEIVVLDWILWNRTPQKQKPVTMEEKEVELRDKIKLHADRLKEYHNSGKKKRSEAQLNLEQVLIIPPNLLPSSDLVP